MDEENSNEPTTDSRDAADDLRGQLLQFVQRPRPQGRWPPPPPESGLTDFARFVWLLRQHRMMAQAYLDLFKTCDELLAKLALTGATIQIENHAEVAERRANLRETIAIIDAALPGLDASVTDGA